MSRWKSFPCSGGSISVLSLLQILIVVGVILHHHHYQTCDAITNNKTSCPPSSCGKITNIKHPFRLQNDPTNCGDSRYELSCENNMTGLTLFSGKYYVKSINYTDYTIRIVDPGIEEGDCSSIPHYFLSSYNLTGIWSYVDGNSDPYQTDYKLPNEYVIYLNCSKQVKDDPGYVDTAPCRVNSYPKSYVYAVAGYLSVESLKDGEFYAFPLKDYCEVKLVAMYSSHISSVSDGVGVRDDVPIRPLSYDQIHKMLLYGFQLSWKSGACREFCVDNQRCHFINGEIECQSNYCYYPMGGEGNCDQMSKLRILIEDIILGIIKVGNAGATGQQLSFVARCRTSD
ncbi:LEAF RUST 10 DISEASE-RESISTANCE LOCUS RECEPTOR-LIKE PROTEIN KINASE 2.5 [Trifolium repens]|nr:LEAF RUST 10 DISEASE-RESISTANCE LOCUS RECEPTOR-LIKE PROTEIN KINASE 2.5 [Trifolium repens]